MNDTLIKGVALALVALSTSGMSGCEEVEEAAEEVGEALRGE